MRKAFILVTIVLLFTMNSFADTIELKNGRKITGQIVKETDKNVVISIGDGSIVSYISRNDIKSIQIEPNTGGLIKKQVLKEKANTLWRQLKKYFYRSLTSTVEILDPSSDLDKIVKILHDKGYMPEIEESDRGMEESQNINLSLKPDSFFVLRDAVKILLKIIYDRKMPTDYLNQLRILDDMFWHYESEYGEPSTSTFFKDFIDSFLEYLKNIENN